MWQAVVVVAWVGGRGRALVRVSMVMVVVWAWGRVGVALVRVVGVVVAWVGGCGRALVRVVDVAVSMTEREIENEREKG